MDKEEKKEKYKNKYHRRVSGVMHTFFSYFMRKAWLSLSNYIGGKDFRGRRWISVKEWKVKYNKRISDNSEKD